MCVYAGLYPESVPFFAPALNINIFHVKCMKCQHLKCFLKKFICCMSYAMVEFWGYLSDLFLKKKSFFLPFFNSV